MSFANFHSEFDRDAECGVGQKLEKGDFEIPDNGNLHLWVTANGVTARHWLIDS